MYVIQGTRLLLNTIKLLILIIIAPLNVFEKIKDRTISKEVFIVFLMAAVICFLRTFSLNGSPINFYEDGRLNNILSILNIPRITWIMNYIFYFFFILSVFLFFKLAFRTPKFDILIISLMSVSGLGVVSHVLFFIIGSSMPSSVMQVLGYLVYLWCITLTLFAIKTSQSTSHLKAFVVFLIAGAPIIFIGSLTSLAPYLAWIV